MLNLQQNIKNALDKIPEMFLNIKKQKKGEEAAYDYILIMNRNINLQVKTFQYFT